MEPKKKWSVMGSALGVLLVVYGVSGCTQTMEEKMAKIQQGMSEQEVIQILGKPEAIDWDSRRDKKEGVSDANLDIKFFYGITYLKPEMRTTDGYAFSGNADYYVEINGDKGVSDAGDASLLDGENIFVRNEDLPRVKAKLDPFYEQTFENQKVDADE